MSVVDVIAVIVAIIGLIAALIARRTWLLVEGDLAESWTWILPSVPVYAISFIVLVVYNFIVKYEVSAPLLVTSISVNFRTWESSFIMKVWEPIVLVLKNIQVLAEFVFLILVLIGLIRQYRLFEELYNKQA